MKLIVVMICIVGLTGSYASVYSQQTKLNLNVQKTMVKDVLKLIEDQSEFSFMYNASKIDVNREVDVNVEKTSVEEILKKVFAGEDVTFTVIDRNIVITPKSAESSVAQQQKSVSGKVTDSSGGSLPGVSVVVKGTTKGVITDANGSYSLANIPANTLLQFSFVGMKMQEIMVGNKTTINVTLAEETVGIDEVVAVGYGTQKRGNLTGAVATISNDKIVKAPVGTTSNALAGQLPGLITKQSGGQPGMDAALLSIRGFGSPLIIVDGVEAEINNVDPNEIESISVLKDASAAIYGARAGNGVILISTKRGNEEKPTITLNSTYSFMGVTEFGKPVNAGQYAELILEANLNAGLPASSSRFQSEDVQKYFSGTDPGYPNANWWNVIMKEWTPEQQHSLSVRGGDKKIKYFGSLSFLNQDLMYKAGGNYYQRFN
ncbi:MAG: carboxypeptidase-like regulatory domain-containing protein, partial [Prolixibacteraceae bacterium]